MTALPSDDVLDTRAEHNPGWSRRSIWLVVVACGAVSLVVAAMASLNLALSDIAPDVHASSNQITWLVDAYTLTLASLLLPAGALGDRFGRRGTLIAGLLIFGVASVMAIAFDSPDAIIGTRVVAGTGAALVMPATLSLITSGVPTRIRPFAVSIWAGATGAAAIVGFLITGVILQFGSWHWMFIAMGISGGSIAGLACTISTSRISDPPRFDITGSVTSVIAVAALVLGFIEGPLRGWSDSLVIVAFTVAVTTGALFIVAALRYSTPLLDVRLFAQRAFGSGAFAILLQFLGSFTVFFLSLQRFQLVQGYSPLKASLALIPVMVVVAIASLIANWLAVRFSLKIVLGPGMLLFGVGLVLLGVFDTDSFPVTAGLMMFAGVGLGLATAPATTAIMACTPAKNHGVASAVNDTSRELGAAIGMALAGSIVAAGFSSRIQPTVDSTSRQIRALAAHLTQSGNSGGKQLADNAPSIAERVGHSLAEAMGVADDLAARGLPPSITDPIRTGAREAFLLPMAHAYLAMGIIVCLGSLVITAWTPMKMPRS